MWPQKALGGCRGRLTVRAGLCVVPYPFGGRRAAEPTVPSALCIQLSACAKKMNQLACKELHAAAAILQ